MLNKALKPKKTMSQIKKKLLIDALTVTAVIIPDNKQNTILFGALDKNTKGAKKPRNIAAFVVHYVCKVVPILYPFHGVLVIGKVVEAQRHSSSSHRWPGDFQQLLNSSMSHKLGSKLLMQQQRCQVL